MRNKNINESMFTQLKQILALTKSRKRTAEASQFSYGTIAKVDQASDYEEYQAMNEKIAAERRGKSPSPESLPKEPINGEIIGLSARLGRIENLLAKLVSFEEEKQHYFEERKRRREEWLMREAQKRAL